MAVQALTYVSHLANTQTSHVLRYTQRRYMRTLRSDVTHRRYMQLLHACVPTSLHCRQEAVVAAKKLRLEVEKDDDDDDDDSDDPYSELGHIRPHSSDHRHSDDPRAQRRACADGDEDESVGEARGRPAGRLSGLRGPRGRRQPGAVRCGARGRLCFDLFDFPHL